MRIESLIDALIAALIMLCSSLTVAWAAPGVEQFSDISQVQYAIMVVSAIVAFLKAYQTLSGRRVIAHLAGKEDPYPNEPVNELRKEIR